MPIEPATSEHDLQRRYWRLAAVLFAGGGLGALPADALHRPAHEPTIYRRSRTPRRRATPSARSPGGDRDHHRQPAAADPVGDRPADSAGDQGQQRQQV
jgi:hypothetical protein